ncbi:CTP synthase 1 [Trichonephila clavipes]|nr:CTP synthase 1 [Trichonephila clavipes]
MKILTDKRIKKIRTDNGLEFVNEQLDTYLANSGIFHEKTIPYNSESNGKAERANRVLLERARSLLYESKLPLKFWAEAINCSTQVSNVTPRKGKEKIPLEIWTGNKPKLNYLKKFGCVAYFHVPKVLRNKFEVPGRRGIMLGYARERMGYRIYDIKNQKVREIGNETWDIDSFFEVSPERNEINQNTEDGVLYNFDINNGPGAIENDNSIPLQTTSSPRTGRIQIPVLELNDVQNQIPVRRSERLKSKLMSVHLVNNVPNSYFEAENSANWKNWKLAMENELDSLAKHKVWEIVQKPAKSKLIKTKWVYSLKQDDVGKNIKYKARLVAAGFNQIKNIDYSELYSPVVNIESFRLLYALAAKLKLNVNFFDVKTAYLYGDLEETVYVLPPPGYEKLIGDDKVCKLKKSIYGLPQSGRNWYMKVKGELENFGLKQLASDNCVFIKSVNQSVLVLCMYVDDLAIFCNNDKMYEDIVTNRTRPDISFVMSYLSQFNHNPEKRHYNLAKRVLRYLMGSKDKKLFYENEFVLGGTIGDIEGMPFVEAFRQFQFRVKKENFCCVHVSLVPQPKATGEHKTKPTQISVRELRGLGLSPDLIVCRSENPIDENVKQKISNFCHVSPEQVICLHDVNSVYHVPIFLEEQGLVKFFHERLHLPMRQSDCSIEARRRSKEWRKLVRKIDHLVKEVKIALVGKYTVLEDSYTSVTKALQHATMMCNLKLNLEFIAAADLEPEMEKTNAIRYHEAWQNLCKADGVIVPGGFGTNGIEGKIAAIQWARNVGGRTGKILRPSSVPFENQMNSLAASVKLTYSASMVDRLTDFCLKVRHEIGVSSIKVMNPPIDTRSSLFVAKSESE